MDTTSLIYTRIYDFIISGWAYSFVLTHIYIYMSVAILAQDGLASLRSAGLARSRRQGDHRPLRAMARRRVPVEDAHLLVASLHRRALLICNSFANSSFQGLAAAAKPCGLKGGWRRRLREWDAALGLTEKISEETVDKHIMWLTEALEAVPKFLL